MLTQVRVKELFDYNSETGVMTRRMSHHNTVKVGDVVGANHNAGYLSVAVDAKRYLVHRIAWLYVYGQFPDNDIDHINHDRKDNRLCNLRSVSRSQNLRNKLMTDKNKSGVVGVSVDTSTGKWRAQISVNKKVKYLGIRESFFEAVCLRLSANNKYGYHSNHGSLAIGG